MSQSEICVSIASFRDPELSLTIRSLLYHAACPERINIVAMWQGDFNNMNEGLDLREIKMLLRRQRKGVGNAVPDGDDNEMSNLCPDAHGVMMREASQEQVSREGREAQRNFQYPAPNHKVNVPIWAEVPIREETVDKVYLYRDTSDCEVDHSDEQTRKAFNSEYKCGETGATYPLLLPGDANFVEQCSSVGKMLPVLEMSILSRTPAPSSGGRPLYETQNDMVPPRNGNKAINSRQFNDSCEVTSKLTLICCPCRYSRGPSWARYIAQQFYNDEPYYLQIDSHMRFRPKWDEFFIGELKRCEELTQYKPILTAYPSGYELGLNYKEYPKSNKANRYNPTLLCASHFDSDGLLRIRGRKLAINTARPIESLFWAAGFSFSYGSVVREVGYDKRLQNIFFGEEQSMWIRLFSHGYDFFCPSSEFVFHQWKRHPTRFNCNLSKTKMIKEQEGIGNILDTPQCMQVKREVAMQLVKETLEIKDRELKPEKALRYLLGAHRPVIEFWRSRGVDIKAQTLLPASLLGGRKDDRDFCPPQTHEAFLVFKSWLLKDSEQKNE